MAADYYSSGVYTSELIQSIVSPSPEIRFGLLIFADLLVLQWPKGSVITSGNLLHTRFNMISAWMPLLIDGYGGVLF